MNDSYGMNIPCIVISTLSIYIYKTKLNATILDGIRS